MGLDPNTEGFPMDWSIVTVALWRNIHTAHKRGQIPVPRWLLYSCSGQGLLVLRKTRFSSYGLGSQSLDGAT